MSSGDTIIGLDVGGSKILLETFDARGRIRSKAKEKTLTRRGHAGFIKQLTALIDGHFHQKIKGIGVAVPGIVDEKNGTVTRTPHLPLKPGFPLGTFLKKRYRVPVAVDNDINAFLTAERERKELKKEQHIVAVMVGTGLGGAIISRGQMVYGKKGFAGEVGHIIINQQGPLKTLEQNVSGHAVPKIARKLGIQKKMRAEDLGGGTPESRKVTRFMVEQLGIGLSNLNLIFNPETIVLGGSIYELFLSPHKKELEKVIAAGALDGRCPRLLRARKSTSVAEGMARMAARF